MKKKVGPAKRALWILLEMLGYGAIIVFPFVVIFTLLYGIYQFCDIPGRLILKIFLGKNLPGWGFILIIGLVLITGAFLRSKFAKQRGINERLLETSKKIPFIGKIIEFIQKAMRSYARLKELQEKRGTVFVLVEYPRKEMWSVAALTGILPQKKGEKRKEPLACTFVFSSPLPFTGYPGFIKKSEADKLERIPFEQAMEVVFSAGLISEGEVGKRLDKIEEVSKRLNLGPYPA